MKWLRHFFLRRNPVGHNHREPPGENLHSWCMFLIPQIKEIFHPWYLIHFSGDFKIPNAIKSIICTSSWEMCRLFIHAYTNGKQMILMVARFVHKLIIIIIKKISIIIIRRIKLCNDLVFQSLEAGSWKAGEGGYRPRQSSPCFTCP